MLFRRSSYFRSVNIKIMKFYIKLNIHYTCFSHVFKEHTYDFVPNSSNAFLC